MGMGNTPLFTLDKNSPIGIYREFSQIISLGLLEFIIDQISEQSRKYL